VTDRATLAPIVARLLRVPEVTVTSFTEEPIGYRVSNPVSAGLSRYRGTADVAGASRAWSLVLKTIRDPGPDPFPQFRLDDAARSRLRDVFRWDREALVYGSGLLDELREGLVAPACLAIDADDRRARIWLEDVVEEAPRWDIERYRLAAYHLGSFNGARLAHQGVMPEWVSRDVIVYWTDLFGAAGLPEILADDAIWSEPVVVAALPSGSRERLAARWADRSRLYAVLRTLPHGFAHLDAFRGNLIGRQRDGRRETVAIDWSFAGLAPIGAELSQLVCASVFYQDEPFDAVELDAATFPPYVDGLRAAGCGLATSDIRRGVLASTIVRWSFLAGALRLSRDPERRQAAEQRTGVRYADHLAKVGRRFAYTERCVRELERSPRGPAT
jgi:hypothetical protein